MPKAFLEPDSKRIAAWRKLRHLLDGAPEAVVETHLNRFQADAATAIRNALRPGDPALESNLSLVRVLAVICGGFLDVDPFNPDWPGRDRLFVGGPGHLVAALAAAAATGHFSLSSVPEAATAEIAMDGAPGLEAIPASPIQALTLGLESATKSAIDKETWRRFFRASQEAGGGATGWEDRPAVWNTYVVVDGSVLDAAFWEKAESADARRAAGLTVVVACTGNTNQKPIAERWEACGWETDCITGQTLFPLYQAIRKPAAGVRAIIE